MAAIQTTLPDASNWQNAVDWEAVLAAGHIGGIVKCTEGNFFRDAWFPLNWGELARLGAFRGAYDFARPSVCSAEADAEYFCSYVSDMGPLVAGDTLVLDMEDTDAPAGMDLLAWSVSWLEYVERRMGVTPWYYSGRWFLEPRGLLGRPELARFPLWVAAYTTYQPQVMCAPLPAWPHATLHQWTSTGSCPGVDGDTDLNCTSLSPADLRNLGYQPAPTGPPPPREPLDHLWQAIGQTQPTYPLANDAFERMKGEVQVVKSVYGYDP